MLSFINHNFNMGLGNNLTYVLILREPKRDHMTGVVLKGLPVLVP